LEYEVSKIVAGMEVGEKLSAKLILEALAVNRPLCVERYFTKELLGEILRMLPFLTVTAEVKSNAIQKCESIRKQRHRQHNLKYTPWVKKRYAVRGGLGIGDLIFQHRG
jgi:hypothetical protein